MSCVQTSRMGRISCGLESLYIKCRQAHCSQSVAVQAQVVLMRCMSLMSSPWPFLQPGAAQCSWDKDSEFPQARCWHSTETHSPWVAPGSGAGAEQCPMGGPTSCPQVVRDMGTPPVAMVYDRGADGPHFANIAAVLHGWRQPRAAFIVLLLSLAGAFMQKLHSWLCRQGRRRGVTLLLGMSLGKGTGWAGAWVPLCHHSRGRTQGISLEAEVWAACNGTRALLGKWDQLSATWGNPPLPGESLLGHFIVFLRTARSLITSLHLPQMLHIPVMLCKCAEPYSISPKRALCSPPQ